MWWEVNANLIHEKGCVLRKADKSQLGQTRSSYMLWRHGHNQVSARRPHCRQSTSWVPSLSHWQTLGGHSARLWLSENF